MGYQGAVLLCALVPAEDHEAKLPPSPGAVVALYAQSASRALRVDSSVSLLVGCFAFCEGLCGRILGDGVCDNGRGAASERPPTGGLARRESPKRLLWGLAGVGVTVGAGVTCGAPPHPTLPHKG